MATLTVTARGQVTFRKDVLKHLGIQPGERIKLDLLPDGRAELRAEQASGSWDAMRGFLATRTNGVRLTIDELDEAVAEAGASAARGDTAPRP